MKNVNDINFDDEVKNSSGLVLVDFSAVWCSPCKAQTPILEQLTKENPELTVLTVDVDDSPLTASKHAVRSVPTLVLYKDGNKVNTKVGLTSLATLKAFIANS